MSARSPPLRSPSSSARSSPISSASSTSPPRSAADTPPPRRGLGIRQAPTTIRFGASASPLAVQAVVAGSTGATAPGPPPTPSQVPLPSSPAVAGAPERAASLPGLWPARRGSGDALPPGAAAGASPPLGSSEETYPFTVSRIDTATAHRAIRTIVHREFAALQTDAEQSGRRLRTYFVAVDLSEEAAYALAWTIGTFLRDGDTLLAVYAVDDGEGQERREPGTATGSRSGTPSGGPDGDMARLRRPRSRSDGDTTAMPPPIGGGAAAMRDAQDTILRLTRPRRTSSSASRRRAHSLQRSSSRAAAAATLAPDTPVRTPSADSLAAAPDRPAKARVQAIRRLTQRCVKALTRCKPCVQVAIEVIHCKSPKHMITEAIDTLEPTLVILGSRGRSTLKGVLLGSFSNYLVTKSSVPVMVARLPSSGGSDTPRKEAPLRARPVNLPDGIDLSNRLVHARVD